MTTFRALDGIRALLARALEQAPTDNPELIESLTEALGEVDAELLRLVTQEQEIAEATDALMGHVDPKPLPVIEPFDIHAEIRKLFLPPAQMGVVA